ncbi:MAG: cellulase family glycosylhydrolase, partial [Myxococcales bacterium]|nr:cellulase family glycosylhydrolase [Myxococcales bacterium]
MRPDLSRRCIAPALALLLAACPAPGDSDTDSASTTASSGPTTTSAGSDTSSGATADPTTSGATTGSSTGATTASSATTATTAETSTTSASSGDPTGDPPGPGGTVPVGGGDYFLLGANYPWKSYGGDFGANNWGVYGVHTKGPEIGGELSGLASDDMRVVRWFVFTDGRAGVDFDDGGAPTGLGEHVFQDMDEAVAQAKAAGVYLVPVLLDFHWCFWAQYNNGVQMGGHAGVITDPAKRAALVDAVVAPLLDRYADEPAILAWEIMNEPEWVIADLPDPAVDGGAEAIALADFAALSAAIADEVHARTDAYVTLGSASLKWHRVWTPAFAAAHGLPTIDLDLYQAHYYSWMDGQAYTDHPELGTVAFSPLVQDYAALALDRPMIIGELELSSGAGERLDTLLNNGYAGAWPW